VAKVYLLSLGCPKNLVDSQGLIKRLADKGMTCTQSPQDADILAVNTCGFIEEAKRESIEEILRIADFKNSGDKKKLVVYGCLAKRFGDELRIEIPEIDALWGVGSEDEIVEYCVGVVNEQETISASDMSLLRVGNPSLKKDCGRAAMTELKPADKFTDTPYSYLKIAEGCDRGCAYCVIPEIRGRFRSRNPEDVLSDARDLLSSGAKELIVVAQDITSYGKDLHGYDVRRLLSEICSMKGDFRVRLLYLYPTSVDEGLLELIASEEKVCKYIDMPLQHSEEKILKLMGRGGSRTFFEKLIARTRRIVSDVSIRTTFIVGFPGETEEDFGNLLDFVRNTEFDRLGAFTYSREEGTTAAKLRGQLPRQKKLERYARLMESQSAISLAKNKLLVGRTLRALVDEIEGGVAVARLASQAPEIDGVVFIEEKGLRKGSFVDVKITEAFDYDLKGKVVK
jgi:ribosomal protein S12 methylthiotransferase